MAISTLSSIPQIEKILQQSFIKPYIERLSRPVVTDVVREQVQAYKKKCLVTSDRRMQFSLEKLYYQIEQACWLVNRQRLQRVVNGTGVIVHTNLGRSPVHAELWRTVTEVNTHYSNLEIDLATGKRGKRKGMLQKLLQYLVKGEDTLVVNNNASSIYLVLHELAKSKEVIVSRGEQIQIGGGFRIPDFLALSGAKLIEVGTTNITTTQDYLNAITEQTAMVLLVHTSNYKIRGFTESPSVKELAQALPKHVVLAVDQGSGATTESMPDEQTVANYIQQGADLVCFSGDKILGGPQAGLVTGKGTLIKQLERNPMMRVFRPGRIVYSLLEELVVRKLNQREDGRGVAENKSAQSEVQLEQRALHLTEGFGGKLRAVRSEMTIGGGASPDQYAPSWSVEINPEYSHHKYSAEKLLEALRNCPLAVIGVIKHGKVQLNMATISDSEISYLRGQLLKVLQ